MFFTWFSHQKEGIAEKVYYTQCRLGNYAAIHVTWPLVNLKLKIRITRNGVVPAQNFCILSLQFCFWNNGRAIKWNTRFLLLFFGPMKCFWARDCKPWDKLMWQMIFPRSDYITISLRQFMCIKWESVQYLPSTANLQETIMKQQGTNSFWPKVMSYGMEIQLVLFGKKFLWVFSV